MAVLTTTHHASTLLSKSSPHSNSQILALLSPALTNSLYIAAILQRLLSTTTLFLAFRAYFLSTILLKQSYYASQVLALQGYYASGMLARQVLRTWVKGMRMSWKATERLREKLFYEFALFILGTGYYGLLIVFWPGWIVIGGGVWGVWWTFG